MKYVGIALVHGYRLHHRPLRGAELQVPPVLLAVRARRAAPLRADPRTLLAGWRILRCNPWSHGGVDRVEDQTLFRGKLGWVRGAAR